VQNVPDLMVKDEVVQAVEAGEFHIYAIDHVDKGIELLTGIPAGDMDDEGNFPEGSINFAAAEKLDELAETWRQYLSINRR